MPVASRFTRSPSLSRSPSPNPPCFSLNKLPQEIFDMVISNVYDWDYMRRVCRLSRYACLSRKWQYAMERKTLQSLIVDGPELGVMEQVLSSPRRASYVRRLSLCFELLGFKYTGPTENTWKENYELLHQFRRYFAALKSLDSRLSDQVRSLYNTWTASRYHSDQLT